MAAVDLLAVLADASDAIRAALGGIDDWGLTGTKPGEHHSDLVADAAAVAVLSGAGLGVLSEESGRHHPERPITVVVDPLDGSTNAAHGIPWYASSLCAVDEEGPRAAMVVNLADATRFEAERGQGATRDGELLQPTRRTRMIDSIMVLNGYPDRWLGWYQYRVLGAAALDLCAVAAGTVDGFIDCGVTGLAPWDYLGGLLVCRESGVLVTEARDLDLVVLDHTARRTLVAAPTPELLSEAVEARQALSW
jgi:fructose-1,6-bisphosphatase/inositol monophosphatase family enzyme